MNWIDTRNRLPQEDNTAYVVSVTRDNYTFKAIAYFSPGAQEWYYSDRGERGDLITDRVNAWVENLAIFTR
jgi:hypothetical protein